MLFAKPLTDLVTQLEHLPGIGPKSAQRLAFHVLKMPQEDVRRLSAALINAREKLRFCRVCQNFSDSELCPICQDSRRDPTKLCIVAEPRDIAAIERAQAYKGLYHVLHGLLDPMRGIGPEQLKVRELLDRLRDTDQPSIEEVVLATNPTLEGDSTALYLAKLIKPLEIKVTRLAYGMPVGGELDYADNATLLSALEYRREF
jgi:recombination protein RecR